MAKIGRVPFQTDLGLKLVAQLAEPVGKAHELFRRRVSDKQLTYHLLPALTWNFNPSNRLKLCKPLASHHIEQLASLSVSM